jgi:hypothetical protein
MYLIMLGFGLPLFLLCPHDPRGQSQHNAQFNPRTPAESAKTNSPSAPRARKEHQSACAQLFSLIDPII